MTRHPLLLVLISLAACLEPFDFASATDAQEPARPRRIGVLLVASSPESPGAQQFRRALGDAGYPEGREVVIEWRSANGDYDRLPQLVADLLQRKVDVIVVESTPAALAVKRATSTIPIVMALVSDPVGSGLVESLAHPGGNVTGLSLMTTDLTPKRLQLLKESIPRLIRVAVLWDPELAFHTKVIEDLKLAAPALSIELTIVGVRRPEELSAAFSAITRANAQALYVIDSALFTKHRETIVALASRRRLPVFGDKTFPLAGGLMSYAADFEDIYRRSAGYVVKILKGAKPGDLPIEQPSKFQLVVNLKTAKVLGLTIPESILMRADEVIR